MGLLTAREESESISEGKSKPHHIGTKNNAILQQEFYQLMINWNPNLYEDQKEIYLNALKRTILALQEKEILSSIMSKYSSHIETEFNSQINKILAE